MRVVVYRRVSTDMQTVESQNVTLKRYIEQNKCEVTREYIDESKSGDSKSRAQYNEMLTHIYDDDYDAILCFDDDRLNRDINSGLDLLLKCKEAKKLVIMASTGQVFDYNNDTDMLMGMIKTWVSSNEKAKLRLRVKAGVERARAERGGTWGAEKKTISLKRYDEYKLMGLSDRKIAKLMNVSRNTLAARLKEREQKEV
ncbi:recombinase family protein [Methanocella sp. MCL-LM]|uniref:recombinase family protein n=1 Tax=Methanocella sp. MCL-LM TaxID=3412035 RepID=UPI003C716AD8